MLLLVEEEIRALVPLDTTVIDTVAEGFRLLHQRRVETPPILRLDVAEHQGEVDVKTAYVRGWDSFAVKLSSGYFGNAAKGLPSGGGLMILLAADTGQPLSLLLDGGYLTTLRTAAAGALAAKCLASPAASSLGLIGTGEQARYQALALALVRPLTRILVWGRRPAQAARCAAELRERLGVEARAADGIEAAVRGSDIVITATPATTPLIQADWLHRGLHITALGSDAPSKQELAAEVLREADVVACDVLSQCRVLGECHHAIASGFLRDRDPIELGAIVAGAHPGRTHAAQVTVCDLTGTGVQDTAIARLAYRAALAQGAGRAL